VDEGATITLNGEGADPGGGPVTYEWDLDDDGAYDTTDEDPVFDGASFDGPSTVTVAVRVTTQGGRRTRAEAEVTIANVAPGAPVLVTPADGAAVPGPTVSFVFHPAPDVAAEELLYRFELHRSEALDDLVQFLPIATNAGQAGQDVEVDLEPPEPGTYYWRVRATDDDDAIGAWSEVFSFTLGDPGGDGDADADADSDADADADADADVDADADADADGDADGDGDGDADGDDDDGRGDVDGCSCRAPGAPPRSGSGVALIFGAIAVGLLTWRRRSA
jgi:MYXO-CTERM domain-containing protein